MLLKADLRRIANARLADADALFMAGRFDGAAYLCGYATEMILKLRICRTLKWEGFPERRSEFEGLSSFKTHDFDTLLHLSGAEGKVKEQFFSEWSTVKTWNPESRYNRIVSTNRLETLNRKREVLGVINATKILMRVL